MKTLAELENGLSARVENVRGGSTFISRVSAMGFTPGAEVLMVKNRGRGPLIAYLRDTQVALGRKEAARIYMRSEQ